mmetsp:Transcript_25096/g.42382  ORF Transcript_25096/g.42382 Transcript_25096/m.42382 type:complete len:86 (+) Transcript_25096:76-333(+)
MLSLAQLNDNVLIHTLEFLNIDDSASIALTAKQFPNLVKMSSRLLLVHLSAKMSSAFLSPKKCMQSNFEIVRRFLKLALAYLGQY